MGWSIGYDDATDRHIGYGVPAYCDHPDCKAEIDRGLAYVCCGQQPYGGENGCGRFFCEQHHDFFDGKCERCETGKPPFAPKPEHPRWMAHVLTHASWAQWRAENPKRVEEYAAALRAIAPNAEPAR